MNVRQNFIVIWQTAGDDDGALGVDDEFDIYEELQLDSISLRSSEKLEGLAEVSDETEDAVPQAEESSGQSTGETDSEGNDL